MPSTNTDLQVAFSICEGDSCSSFEITDTTGIYSANNEDGWGAPNPTIASIVTAELEVEFPDGTIVTLDLLTLSSDTFPNTSDLPFEITAAMLGLSDQITDGVYIMTYTVTGTDPDSGPWESSCTEYILFYCQTDCCLKSLFASIPIEDCIDCKNNTLDRIEKAYLFLESAKAAACCTMKNKAAALLANASFICGQTVCKSC